MNWTVTPQLITPEYKALLVEKHLRKPWGGAGASWVPFLLPVLNAMPDDVIRVLDFGCGRGTLKIELERLYPGVTVLEYDPGVIGKDLLPSEPVDLVVCTDVMEHVELEFVDDTLRTINWFAARGTFFNIESGESRSLLPDGRNTHITCQSPDWWAQKLQDLLPQMNWRDIERRRSRLVVYGERVTDVA